MLLRSLAHDTFVLVPPAAMVGRDASCAVRLASDQTSAIHAELRWRGGGWDLRDKGSRNGTSVDAQRLTGGIPAAVVAGATLRFGDETWKVLDDGPPVPALLDPDTGAVEHPAGGRLGPLVLERGEWYLGDERVSDGARVGERLLFAPPPPDSTSTAAARIALSQARVRIVAPQDLSSIDVHVEQGPERVFFGERAWGIALYVLAEARLAEPDDGWIEVDKLARRAGLTRKVLDIYLARAREAFVAAGIAEGDGIVEVRRGGRRLGVKDVVLDVRS